VRLSLLYKGKNDKEQKPSAGSSEAAMLQEEPESSSAAHSTASSTAPSSVNGDLSTDEVILEATTSGDAMLVRPLWEKASVAASGEAGKNKAIEEANTMLVQPLLEEELAIASDNAVEHVEPGFITVRRRRRSNRQATTTEGVKEIKKEPKMEKAEQYASKNIYSHLQKEA
jgi:hypothetical protein